MIERGKEGWEVWICRGPCKESDGVIKGVISKLTCERQAIMAGERQVLLCQRLHPSWLRCTAKNKRWTWLMSTMLLLYKYLGKLTSLKKPVGMARALVKWALIVSGRGLYTSSYAKEMADTIRLETVWGETGIPKVWSWKLMKKWGDLWRQDVLDTQKKSEHLTSRKWRDISIGVDRDGEKVGRTMGCDKWKSEIFKGKGKVRVQGHLFQMELKGW